MLQQQQTSWCGWSRERGKKSWRREAMRGQRTKGIPDSVLASAYWG